MISVILLQSLSVFSIFYSTYQTLQEKRPDLCKCEDFSYESSPSRIFNAPFSPVNDLQSVGCMYFKEFKSRPKKSDFNDYDYHYSIFCTVVLLNEFFLMTAAHW